MLNCSNIAAGAALAIGLASGAVAQDAETVVATVNGTDITLGEMIIVRTQLPQQYQQLPDDVLFEGVLDQLVQQQLLSDTMEEEPSRVTWALQNERRSLLAGEAISAIGDEAVTEEAVQAAYDAAYANQEPATEYNASHILLETESAAEAAIARIEGGADFADTARELSTGPTGPNGGELGWFSDGMMVEPFQNAVAEMEPGEISGPVQTQFGWHVIRLNEVRDQAIPPLEEVRAEIAAQVQRAALDARLAELTESATIVRSEDGEVDPSALSNLDLLQD